MLDKNRVKRLISTAAVALALMGLGACSNKDNGGAVETSGSSTTAAAALFGKLPANIQQSKQINVGSDISYPPVESFKEGTQEAQGIDIDIANAMGSKLGVKFNFQNVTFEGI